ncbi:MAG: AAA family ATPase [Acidimicrobiales bacterium]
MLRRTDDAGLIYRGRVNILYGAQESLKSWAALVAAVQDLENGGHVIYLDHEDTPSAVIGRLQELGVDRETLVERLTYISPLGSYESADTSNLTQIIEACGKSPPLVVIDAMSGSMINEALDPLGLKDVETYLQRLPADLNKQGCTVIIIDHVTKDRKTLGPIGSERKLSGINGVGIKFEKGVSFGRGKTGDAKLFVKRDKVGGVREFTAGGQDHVAVLRLTSTAASAPTDDKEPTYTVSYQLEPPTPNTFGQYTMQLKEDTVVKVVGENPGISRSKLQKTIGGAKESVNEAVKQAEAHGRIIIAPPPEQRRPGMAILHYPAVTESDSDDDE